MSEPRKRTTPKAPPAGRRTGAFTPDALDHRIIDGLRADGRMSTKDLAQRVGANEAVVRARIRKLEKAGHMRVVAMVDLATTGFELLSVVGVTVRGRDAAAVARDLSAIPQVMTAIVMLGSHDIELRVIARDLTEYSQLMTAVLPRVPGVERLIPSLAVEIMKHENEWVPFS